MERPDPFANIAMSGARGPGWQRAAQAGGVGRPDVHAREAHPAASVAAKARDDLSIGMRIFHQKFGYGIISAQDSNKLEIDFETAGRKRVIDSFVSIA